MKLSIDHIDKPDFLISYKQTCIETYKKKTIHNAFKAIKLILYDPIQVLSQFHIEI